MHEEANPILGFRRMALLERVGRGGHVTYWRHLLSDDKYMYVMKVKIEKAPKNSLPYERWELRKHIGLFGTVIQEVEEVVCPKWMLEAQPDEDARNAIALKWNMIAWIVLKAGDALITDRHVRAEYIEDAAKDAGVQPPRIRALLTRYFYYGAHEYALMSLNKFKGGPNVPRFNITRKKMGKPNDNVVLNPKTKLTGRNMTPYYLGRWREVLWEEYVLSNKNVSEAYETLLLRLRGFNRNDKGEIVSYPISPEKLPEKSLFLRYGSKIIREFEMKRKKLGELEWNNKYAARRGHTEDLTHGVIDIYDFDGMEFNIELLYGEENLGHVGKPNVLLAVDRRSRAVVGWYVWLGKENGYAYKHCLFNAFTSKDSRLARYDVSHLRGFVHGVCEQAFFDRGPGISLKVTQAVTKEMRVDSLITKPRDGKGKSPVENVNGIFQNKLANMRGAFRRTDSVRDQDKHRNAEVLAALEFRQFMQLLLAAISDYNLYTDVSHLLTADMLQAKPRVRPNPKDIFIWNRAIPKRGDVTYDWPASAIYKNLLEKCGVVATDGFVTIAKASYTSTELQLFYEQSNSGPSQKKVSPPVVVYRFAETDEILAWERPDGSLDFLNITERHHKQYQDAEQWLHLIINKIKNADVRKQRIEQARNAALPVAKEEKIRKIDGHPKKRPSKGEKLRNRAEANNEIVSQDFQENLELLGLRSEGIIHTNEIAIEDGLVGYRKPIPSDSYEEADW